MLNILCRIFQEWQARADVENVGFRVRWKTIWDHEFPHAWTSFLKKTNESIQSELRRALRDGMAQTPSFVSASLTNFTHGIGEKYCKTWRDQPTEHILDEFFASFKNICATPVLREFNINQGSSWVTISV